MHIEGTPLHVTWVFSDASPVRSLLHAFKYERRPDLADVLASPLGRRLAPVVPPGTLCVPVPSHRLRILERGYCQAAVLAGRVAAHLGCAARSDVLARRTHAGSQTRLHAPDRRRNVQDAFMAVPGTPRPILLIDDVVTTGATLATCAAVLRAAGWVGPGHEALLLAAAAVRPPLPVDGHINP